MKLLRIRRTIVVEEIIKVPDKELDNQINNDRSVDGKRDYAKQVKEKLDVDSVEVRSVRHYYTDVKKSGSKKTESKKAEPKNPVVKKTSKKTKSAE